MKLVPLQSFSLLLSSLLLLLLTVVEPSTQFRQEAVLTNGRAANRMAEDEPPPDSLLSRRQNRFFQEAEDDQEPDRFEQDSSNRFFRERGEELKRFQREERERQMEAAAARLQMEDANDGYRAEKNDYTRDGDGYRSQARLEEEGDDNGDGGDDSLVRELAAMQDKSNPDDFQVNRRVKSEREEELMAMLQNEQFSKPPADVISQNEQFSKPPAKKPKKVTFEENTDMDALVRRMALSTDNLEAEMEEEDGDNGGDDALSQWVMVTAEGYQHEATQDEMEEVLEMSREMMAKTSGYTESSYEAERRRKRGSTTSRTQVTSNNSTTALRQRVIGSDRRRVIHNTQHYPYSAMGRLQTGCSGVFISPRHILTAGHCIYNPYSHRWIRHLNFQRGKNCNGNRGNYHYWKYAVTVWGWVYGRRGYDYAIIVVKNPSPTWMSFGWQAPMPRYYVHTAGYPTDKPNACLWQSSCHLQSRYDTMMTYTCDTYNGMSGSPVYANHRFFHTHYPVVYGVHVGAGKILNLCVRITRQRYNTLQYIMRKYK